MQYIAAASPALVRFTSIALPRTSPVLFARVSTRFQFQSPNKPQLSFLRKMETFWSGRGDNKSLIRLLQDRVITSKTVADVMEKIDRGIFIPPGNPPYVDSPMPIGYNATISAPHMHALCLELLEAHLQPGMAALDIGSGTGYLTACFAFMVGQEGYAVGVEHIPELVQQAIQNVKRTSVAYLLESGYLSFQVADGRHGWPEKAPYDAIHVGAAASQIPEALIQQLKPGGRMVIPVGNFYQDLQVIDKHTDGTLKQWSKTSVSYVPLTSKNEQLGS
eukprot:c24514_g1_i2 orf=238-1065(+)